MSRPFPLTDSVKQLSGSYPPHDVVEEVLRSSTRPERFGFAQLWLAEGIPFAFRGQPMIYQAVRDCVAKRLGVPPNAVTLIGSGRIGYSLSPCPEFGRAFGTHSDLDLAIIEEGLFSKLAKDFNAWKDDFAAGRIAPRNANEQRLWPENVRRIPDNLALGFVDPYKIPAFLKYETAQSVLQTQWLVLSKIKATTDAPHIRSVSIRAYLDWNAFMNRMDTNLQHTVRSLIKVQA